MPNFQLNISEDVVNILMHVADQIGVPPEIEDTAERMELAIDAMAQSVDSQIEPAAHSDGEPLQMGAAVEALLNPNISTDFTQPNTAKPAGNGLTWEEIVALYPANHFDDVDETTKQAITIVFNELPEDEWTSEHAGRLVEQTVELLRKEDSKKTI